ncbi:MAG: MFS transporter [Acidimicrobiia bacterium]|nr:MFS transporter [Acidimicrobiia bacterium]
MDHRASDRSVSEAPGQNRQLVVLAIALVLAMSTWFSTAAVLPQLRTDWGLSSADGSWLAIVVQLGFVAGAVASASTNLADRFSPRRVVMLGAFGASAANAAVVVLDAYGPALVARFLTGAFLAGVYPPALKAMSSWFRRGRGLALGVMIGALTAGSALPHLINGLGGLDWKPTLLAASAATVLGGIVAEVAGADGPFATARAPFDPRQLGAIVASKPFRLASLGYFGHMWELYAMWTWAAAFYADAFGGASRRWASLAAFAVIGVGAAGSVYAGLVSDRRSRTEAAALALRWSASAAVVVGFLVDAPVAVVLAIGLVWGFWVVADSAQFSAIVTEVADPRYVGTALTIQLAAGFTLTVFSIFLVPIVRDAHGWGWAFLMLAPGPVLGMWAMRALASLLGTEDLSVAADVDEPVVYVSPFF